MELGEHEYLCIEGDRDWWQVGMRAATVSVLPRDAFAGRALDLGCGCGYFVRELRARGVDARGVEIEPYAVAYACSLGLGDVVAEGTLQEALADARDLALVSALDVLPHRSVDQAQTVEAVERALRPGGRLLIRVPALPRLYGAHDRFVHQTRRYKRADLCELADAARLTLERMTFANCALLPLVLAGRAVEHLGDRSGAAARSSNRRLPAPVNAALRRVLTVEAAAIARGATLPWGSSLLAVLRKPT